MKQLKKIIMLLSGFVGIVIFLFVIALMVLTFFGFKPEPIVNIEIVNPQGSKVISKKNLTAMIWNIGYAGLGKEMDFFYDGGENVRPTETACLKNLEEISKFIKSKEGIDFVLIQEVDKKSKRSYRQNQVEMLGVCLPEHNSAFAKNYDAPFVPVPLFNPMGKVVSGLNTFSGFDPVSCERIGFPGNFTWPKRLFMLDRCYIIQKFHTADGKYLVLINTHNSAFDDGDLRIGQLHDLRDVALKEFGKGNYVVIGGDWNQNPPGFEPDEIPSGDKMKKNDLGNIPPQLLPAQWQWCYDGTTASNRSLNIPYFRGKTTTTVIDFFLLSPNLRLLQIETIDLGFENSDHNPVMLNFSIEGI